MEPTTIAGTRPDPAEVLADGFPQVVTRRHLTKPARATAIVARWALDPDLTDAERDELERISTRLYELSTGGHP
jgi:hypothetical protein